jgi:hypothetical protein
MDYVSSVYAATTEFVGKCIAKAKAEPIKTALVVIGLAGVICGAYHLTSGTGQSSGSFQSPICTSSPQEDAVTTQTITELAANNQSASPLSLYASQGERGIPIQLTLQQQRLAFGEGRDLTEKQTRALYNAIAKPLVSESQTLLKNAPDLAPALAAGALDTRAAARTYTRERNSLLNQLFLERRDAWVYGFKMQRPWTTFISQLILGGNTGPTCEELSVRNSHNASQIIESSGRSNEEFNAKYGKEKDPFVRTNIVHLC